MRRETSPSALPGPFAGVTVARDIGELDDVHAALVCVPTLHVRGVAEGILQQRIPVIECAQLEGGALAAHHRALDTHARSRKVAAIVAAGWDPRAVQLFQRLFGAFIPVGQTLLSTRPGVNLHHAAVAEDVAGVAGALATQLRGADGRVTHYIYVELARRTDLEQVTADIVMQPAFAGAKIARAVPRSRPSANRPPPAPIITAQPAEPSARAAASYTRRACGRDASNPPQLCGIHRRNAPRATSSCTIASGSRASRSASGASSRSSGVIASMRAVSAEIGCVTSPMASENSVRGRSATTPL